MSGKAKLEKIEDTLTIAGQSSPCGTGEREIWFFVYFNYLHIILCQFLWRTKTLWIANGRKWSCIKYNHLSNVSFRTNLHSYEGLGFHLEDETDEQSLRATPLNYSWEFNYEMMTLSKECIKSLKTFSYLRIWFLSV